MDAQKALFGVEEKRSRESDMVFNPTALGDLYSDDPAVLLRNIFFNTQNLNPAM